MHIQPGQTVFVGLSGGVDSAVAALRLQRAGFNVVGVFIKVWHPTWLVCNWEAERLDAMRVAAHLNIPFLTCDAARTYRDAVAKYFIDAYQKGLTPNPDVMCNRHIKFGAFYEFARAHGAAAIATGHYAQVKETRHGLALVRGVDTQKDQSYFLWTLTTEDLAHTLLPVGSSEKSVIRQEAHEAGIPTATKRDSQGICFLGHVDIADFLGHYLELTPGAVLDTSGHQIGTHHGAFIYTLGQRHGFSVTTHSADTTPYYVTRKDVTQNTITVDHTPPYLARGQQLQLCELVLREPLSAGDMVEIQTRYRQQPIAATVTSISAHNLELALAARTDEPAPGQSCVLYDGDRALGGGIIATAWQ